jgi:carboxylesterase type B
LGVSVSTLLAELETGGDTATEDCLFLDVMVPESIFNQRDSMDYAGGTF